MLFQLLYDSMGLAEKNPSGPIWLLMRPPPLTKRIFSYWEFNQSEVFLSGCRPVNFLLWWLSESDVFDI